MLTPIVFEGYVEVHFDDISTYGTISPSRHIDYVITSRWKSFKQIHGESAQAISTAAGARIRP